MKKFEDLDVIDDFLMSALAADPEEGEKFCRTLLKGLLQYELGEIRVTVQRVIPANIPTQRGIRMDVEVLEMEEAKDVLKNIYDIEPHIKNNVNLPKHNRFYQAKIDGRNMKVDCTFYISIRKEQKVVR